VGIITHWLLTSTRNPEQFRSGFRFAAMPLVNLTPHAIVIDGVSFPSTGTIARAARKS